MHRTHNRGPDHCGTGPPVRHFGYFSLLKSRRHRGLVQSGEEIQQMQMTSKRGMPLSLSRPPLAITPE
jgi:hypothetical protein